MRLCTMVVIMLCSSCVMISFPFERSCLYAETVDKIVAVVNDEPITQSELDAVLMPVYEQYRSSLSGRDFVEKMSEARTNLLNQLIEDKFVTQESKRAGIEVKEEEVDAQMQELKGKFPTEKEFMAFLTEQKLTLDKIRKRFEEQTAIRKLHDYEVRSKVTVSPSDIETYYKEHAADFTEKEKIKVRTLMIKKSPLDPQNSFDKAREMIDMIMQRVKAGENFSDLAKQYSQGTHAADGGDMGFVERGQMIPEFDNALFTLKVGELSPILETDVGYHLFLVEAQQEQKLKPFDEVKDQIHEMIYMAKAKERFNIWMDELKKNAYISIK
jgi:peptidyl-prolyl cis-trans isomerase SurA